MIGRQHECPHYGALRPRLHLDANHTFRTYICDDEGICNEVIEEFFTPKEEPETGNYKKQSNAQMTAGGLYTARMAAYVGSLMEANVNENSPDDGPFDDHYWDDTLQTISSQNPADGPQQDLRQDFCFTIDGSLPPGTGPEGKSHVLDLWCTVPQTGFHGGNLQQEKLEAPIQSKPDGNTEYPGAIEWRPQRESSQDVTQSDAVTAFSAAQADAEQDAVLAVAATERTHVTIVSYGYADSFVGKRELDITMDELPDWRAHLMQQWQDYAPRPPFFIWAVKPPPEEGPARFTVIIQCGAIAVGRNLILIDVHFDDEDYTRRVIEVPIVVVHSTLLQAAGVTDWIESSAVIKHGSEQWLRGFPQITHSGDYVRALLTRSDAVSLIQRSASRKATTSFGSRSRNETGANRVCELHWPKESAGEDHPQPAQDRGGGTTHNSDEDEEEQEYENDEESEESSRDTSGSEFDPGSYGWEDELPQGLVKIAAFKKGAQEPLLTIASMRTREELHANLATLWRIPERFIKDTIFVYPEPQFAVDNQAWPIITEQTFDRNDPDIQKIVVLQIEYYHAIAATSGVATEWRVVIFPDTITREEVIEETDALNYCEAMVGSRCLVWHHGDLWPQQGPAHQIRDGDLLRVAIPPINEEMEESTWVRVQDAFDAGRTVGFPGTQEDPEENQRERSEDASISSGCWDSDSRENDITDYEPPTPRDHHPCGNPSGLGSPAGQQPNSDTDRSIGGRQRIQPRLQVEERSAGVTNLYPEEVWVKTTTLERNPHESQPVVLYGLLGEHIGTRRGRAQRLDRQHLEYLVNRFWPALTHHRKNLILVQPQPLDNDPKALHILVEYIDEQDQPHPGLSPILEDLHLWGGDGTREDIRQPAYQRNELNKEQLLHGLGPWCDEGQKYYCDVWIREKPMLQDPMYQLQPGDLVNLRLTPKWPEEMAWVAEEFPNAPQFYHDVIGRSATEPINNHGQWYLHQKSDTTLACSPPWYGQHSPRAIVEAIKTGMEPEEQIETYFAFHHYQTTGEMHFVAQSQQDNAETCLLAYVVQTVDGITEEGTKLVALQPRTSIAHILEAAGFPRWSRSTACAVTIQVNGRLTDDEGGLTVRSGDTLQTTISVCDWSRLAEDLSTTSSEATSLLQVNAVRKKKFQIKLANQLENTGRKTEKVNLPITLRQVENFLAAWYEVPLASIDELYGKIEMPTTTIAAIAKQKEVQMGKTLHLFTDGSYDAKEGAMGWSFVVLRTNGKDYLQADQAQCVGYACGTVCMDHNNDHWTGASTANAYVAEMEALLHAQWWAIGHDEGGEVHLHYDATSAGNAAKGAWSYEKTHKLCVLTRVLAQSLEVCSTNKVEYHYVPAHTGDPWNELADTLANSCRKGEIPQNKPQAFKWTPWLTGSYVLAAEHLPTALQLLQGKRDLPEGDGTKFEYKQGEATETTLDALWPLSLDKKDLHGTTSAPKAVSIKCCTYNVRTLQDNQRGEVAGVAEYLRLQFTQQGYHICALQETRAQKSSTIESADFIRLVAEGCNGQGGCELWFSKKNHIGNHEAISLQNLTVIHQEPSIIAVRIRLGTEFLVCLSAHAPHSGHGEEERNQWWKRLQQIVSKARSRGRLLLMGDFNAQIGSELQGHIGERLNAKTTPNGSCLMQLLQAADLWIPATYDHCHHGEDGTWIHPKTKQTVRIDYIAVDQRLAIYDAYSALEDEIDHPSLGEDHRAVQLCFSFALKQKTKKRGHCQIDEIAIVEPQNKDKVEDILRSVRQCYHWHTNVHDHYAAMSKTIYQELASNFPQQRKQPRKHYISQATWLCRASKLAIRKELNNARRQGEKENESLLVQQLHLVSNQLRQLLHEDRKQHVNDLLEKVDKVSPTQLFAQLRRLGIGSQMKKYSNKALPCMRKADGSYAESYEESQEVWRDHASALEGGQQIDGEQLLALCDLRQRTQQNWAPKGQNIPTRTQIERACQKLRPFKARGPDGLPAGLFHNYPAIMASIVHPLLMKMACTLSEPLGFKGGKLVHLYKGRGPADEPENRRGILISNHMSKVAHSTFRGQFMPFLEKGMSPMQVGGRAHKSVQQGAHMLRLFMDLCKQKQLSCGVVFLDIKTAYYKVIRQLVVRDDTAEGRAHSLLASFNLPPEALQSLEMKLKDENSVARRMGLGPYMEAFLGELHTDTWFTTPGLEGLTKTTIGTRPGSCFADVFFNFLFAEVIKEVKEELAEQGVMTELRWSGAKGLQADPGHHEAEEIVVETIWADDLALFFQHSDPNQLVGNLQAGCTALLNACLRYGLAPNFARGKTEAVVALRGKGAVRARRHWFTEEGGKLPLPQCNGQESTLRMVARYKHLGGVVDARATSKAEVQARLGQAKQAFRRYKKTLFTARAIDTSKRSQLLRPFVLSILEYNLGTLTAVSQTDKQAIATALLSMYKVIMGCGGQDQEDHKMAWPRLCYALQLPTPLAILQMARVRYFSQIFRYGGEALWAMISTQQSWLADCREAFGWVYHQIAGSTKLPDPSEDWQPWATMIANRPKRLAGLLQRAWKHEVIQQYNNCIVEEGYNGFVEAMELAGYDFPDEPEYMEVERQEHACLACQKVFGSRTGWASHAFKCHKRTNPARQYASGTHCLACNTEYWEYKRLLLHLRYSGKCRRKLARANLEVEQVPGIGSRIQKKQREELLQPWVPTPGVDLPMRNYWAGVGTLWDEELLQDLFHAVPLDENQTSRSVDSVIEDLRGRLTRTTVEFRVVRITLECWKDSMMDVAANASRNRAALIKAFFITLGQIDLAQWLLPQRATRSSTTRRRWKTLLDGELACHNGWPRNSPKAEWYKTMFIIHFFSGRRRPKDLQSYLEQLPCPSGIHLEVLSADIIFGEGGDFSQREIQRRWLTWMALGYVLAFYAGPPCETYSVARNNEIQGIDIRAVRSRQHPWGFSSLRLREAKQVLVGNLLMLFVLQAVVIQAATGHFACVEHPEEPKGAKNEGAVSVWRLTLMEHIYRMARTTRCCILQGKFGAPSPKPTSLLFVGPRDPRRSLRKFESNKCSTGVSIGLEASGRAFKTAKLKEYPGDLCAGLAQALQDWIEEHDPKEMVAYEDPAPSTISLIEDFKQALNSCGVLVAGAGSAVSTAQTATRSAGSPLACMGLNELETSGDLREHALVSSDCVSCSAFNYLNQCFAKCMDCFAGWFRFSGLQTVPIQNQFFDEEISCSERGLVSSHEAELFDFGVCMFPKEESPSEVSAADTSEHIHDVPDAFSDSVSCMDEQFVNPPVMTSRATCCDSSLCFRALRGHYGLVVEARRAGGSRIPKCTGQTLMTRRCRSCWMKIRRGSPPFLLIGQLHRFENQAAQLLGGGKGGGKKKKTGVHPDPLLGALTELLQKFETKSPPQDPKQNAKPSLRDALAKVLDRPNSGRGLLNKLKSLVRAAEGGHLTVEVTNSSQTKQHENDVPKDKAAPKGQPAKSILKSAKPCGPSLNLTEKASDFAPLAEFHLRSEDWPQAAVLKSQAVLTKLRRGEPPHSKAVAAIMTELEAEEAMAYWLQHQLSEIHGASLTCVVGVRPTSLVAWAPPTRPGVNVSTQWLTLQKAEKTAMQSVMLVQLGASQAPRNPIVAKPSGAKVPERQDTETVRLTVHGKYTGERLSSHLADSFLKQIWPAEAKAARNFASWRTEKSKTNDVVALTSYVTGSKAVVKALLQKSGTTPLFVARLAKDKINDEQLHPFWVPRVDGTSDYEYLQMARKALAESKCTTGLMHRLGGGKDLGFLRPVVDIDPCKMPPYFWHAFTPAFWTAEDLVAFLESANWEGVQVLGQSGRAWRFRASKRPSKETSFGYDLQPDGMLTVVPQPRKVEARSHLGKSVGRPKAPWDASDAKSSGEATEMQVDENTKGPAKKPSDQALPAPKRSRHVLQFGETMVCDDVSCPLNKWQLVEAGGEGACGYRSLVAASILDSKVDAALTKDEVFKQAVSLRVATAQHFKKNEGRFKSSWAFDAANASHTGHSWEEYLNKVEEPDFDMDELQLRAAAEKLKKKIVVFYLDPQKAWSRRVFNGRAEGQPLVLLLKDEHYRLAKPIGQGFPLEWNKNLGGSFPVQGGGAKSVSGQSKASWSTFRVGSIKSKVVRSSASTSTFRVQLPSSTSKGSAEPALQDGRLPSFGRRRAPQSQSSGDNAKWCSGALYQCPCGWRLDDVPAVIPRKLLSQRIHAFQMHWKECQPGIPAPCLTREQRKQKQQHMANKASEARSRLAWTAWCNLKTILPAQIFENLHVLDEEPCNIATRTLRQPFLRPCRRCLGAYSLGYCRTATCPGTPNEFKVTCLQLQAAIREAEGCRTKRAMPVTTSSDPRKSSRRSTRVLSQAQQKKAKDDMHRRGFQM